MSFLNWSQGIPAENELARKKREKQEAKERDLLERWKEYQHVIGILRSHGTPATQEQLEEEQKKWIKAVM